MPKPEAIEHFSGSELHAWLVTEHEEEAVSVAALNVSEVTTVEYELGQPDRAADAPSPATEPVLTATEPVLTATEPVLTATDAPAPETPIATAPETPITTAPETPITTAPEASTPGASVAQAPAAQTAPEPTPPKLAAAPAPAPAPAAAADQHATRTVRVDAERLDALMHAMGELVIHRTGVEA